jgi:hypothetical protein
VDEREIPGGAGDAYHGDDAAAGPPPERVAQTGSPGPPRRGRGPLIVVSLVALAAVAAAVVLFVQAAGLRDDRDDLEERVAQVEDELAEAGDDLRDAQDARDAARDAADAAEARADEAQAQLDEVDRRLAGFFAAAMTASDDTLTTDQADCLAEVLVREVGRARLLQMFAAAAEDPSTLDDIESEIVAEAARAILECDIPLDGRASPPGESGLEAAYTECFDDFVAEGPGDNAGCDALHDACSGGDMAACDDLWVSANVGSEYERFGATCGDRIALGDPGSEGGCTRIG